MSETFSIWHGEQADDDSASCYITAINVQELGAGSDEFVVELLDQLGLDDHKEVRWQLSEPFLIDFLSSDRTENWRDSWLLTWKLLIDGVCSGDLPQDPRDLLISDTTWSGQESDPVAFEVIASGTGAAPDPGGSDLVTHRCGLGHLHVEVPVAGGDVTAAADRAEMVASRCQEVGWSTGWRDPRAPV